MTYQTRGLTFDQFILGQVFTSPARTVTEADVELVFDPPWNQSMMSDAAKLETGMF